MRSPLHRCCRSTDLTFDPRVIDRLSADAARPDLGDMVSQLLKRERETLELVGQFDHDASHGASSVGSLRHTLDGMALPHLQPLAVASRGVPDLLALLRMTSTPVPKGARTMDAMDQVMGHPSSTRRRLYSYRSNYSLSHSAC